MQLHKQFGPDIPNYLDHNTRIKDFLDANSNLSNHQDYFKITNAG